MNIDMNTINMRDGMTGLMIGDALGCPVQFRSRQWIASRPAGPVVGMEGYGTFNMPAGTWTDDSSLALATLASLNDKQKIDLDDIMSRFVDWEINGAYTPYGQAFDQGITCLDAIYHYRKNKDVFSCGKTGDRANGNGALMRILPVCLFLIDRQNHVCTSDAEAIHSIHQVAALTHNHLRSHIANGLYYFMAKAIVQYKDSFSLNDCLKKGLDDGFGFYRQDLRNLTEMNYYSRLYDIDVFNKTDRDDIKSSGYVVDSLEAAVWCLITTNQFSDCLLKAVNLGDDTDTVAAIAGGLAGLYYGYDNIPADWLAKLVSMKQ